MMPIKIEDRKLIAYVEPSYDGGGRVVSIPPTGGSHTPASCCRTRRAPRTSRTASSPKAVDYVDGRFYISTTRLTGNDEAKEKLMLAFGK